LLRANQDTPGGREFQNETSPSVAETRPADLPIAMQTAPISAGKHPDLICINKIIPHVLHNSRVSRITEDVVKPFDRFLGWATPIVPRADYASLARELGHMDPRKDCLPRLQGLCPGLEFCHDCSWREGTARQGG
jgi:hypothetical protein